MLYKTHGFWPHATPHDPGKTKSGNSLIPAGHVFLATPKLSVEISESLSTNQLFGQPSSRLQVSVNNPEIDV